MLKCNQPYIIPLIIAVVLIIIIYYGYKYKKIFFVLCQNHFKLDKMIDKSKVNSLMYHNPHKKLII